MKITSDDIKALRERMAVNQSGLADSLGVRQATVSRLENGTMEISGPIEKLLERLIADHPTAAKRKPHDESTHKGRGKATSEKGERNRNISARRQ